jgi:hypothetical protein
MTILDDDESFQVVHESFASLRGGAAHGAAYLSRPACRGLFLGLFRTIVSTSGITHLEAALDTTLALLRSRESHGSHVPAGAE